MLRKREFMDNATKFLSFPVCTGIRKGGALFNQTVIGNCIQSETPGVYRILLDRPYPKTYFMVGHYKDPGQYSLYQSDELPVAEYPTPCGSAKLDSTFQSYLEVNLAGYPPLFMELFPVREAA
jgi:hypothetical protein